MSRPNPKIITCKILAVCEVRIPDDVYEQIEALVELDPAFGDPSELTALMCEAALADVKNFKGLDTPFDEFQQRGVKLSAFTRYYTATGEN